MDKPTRANRKGVFKMDIRIRFVDKYMDIEMDGNMAFQVCNDVEELIAYGTAINGITWQENGIILPWWIDEIVNFLAGFAKQEHYFMEQVMHELLNCECFMNRGFHVLIDF